MRTDRGNHRLTDDISVLHAVILCFTAVVDLFSTARNTGAIHNSDSVCLTHEYASSR